MGSSLLSSVQWRALYTALVGDYNTQTDTRYTHQRIFLSLCVEQLILALY